MVTLARFTPSLLDEATLERLFVNREHLLTDAVARIDRAATNPERGHKLFVGPRGSGKTHLLSLVYYRARRLDAYGTGFRMAWLPEDPWTIASLDDFLGEVLKQLDPPGDQGLRSGQAVDDIVRASAEHGPIVVLVENLDQILDAIGVEGQRRLRALLETHRPLLLVATAVRITEHLIGQAEPFYGFFDTTTLEPFDVDEAAAMLQAIADFNDDQPLLHRLDEPQARARLAAIKHLAGGQPRVWALLAAGLTIDGLDDLVSVLIERFDDLTPYYQERLVHLAMHERRVVRALADANRAMTVRDLAATTGIEQRSLAKTVTELRRRGWVRPRVGLLTEMADRRLSFYELAEPLARLAFQLKAARGRPVKLVLDFLTAWFDSDELASGLGGDSSARPYLDAANALAREPVMLLCHSLAGSSSAMSFFTLDVSAARYAPRRPSGNPELNGILESLDDALAAYERGDPVPLLEQPTELSQIVEHQLGTTTAAGLRHQLARLALAGEGDVSDWVARIEEALPEAGDVERVAGLLTLGLVHGRLGHDGAAALACQQAVDAVTRDPNPDAVGITIAFAEELIRDGASDRALDLLEAVHPIAPAELRLVLALASETAYLRTGQPGRVVAEWQDAGSRLAAELGTEHRHTLGARTGLAASYRAAGRLADAIAVEERVVADSERLLGAEHPDTLAARGNLASFYESAGRMAAAVDLGEQVVADTERILGAEHPNALVASGNLAISYRSAGRMAEAVNLGEQVVSATEHILGAKHPDALVARGNLATSYKSAGRTAEATAIEEELVTDFERLLGTEHPHTLTARTNLAYSYWSAGRTEEAVVTGEQVVRDFGRLLGAEHPTTLNARANLAGSYWSAGRTVEAVTLLEQVAAEFERLLGSDHADTMACRSVLASWRAE